MLSEDITRLVGLKKICGHMSQNDLGLTDFIFSFKKSILVLSEVSWFMSHNMTEKIGKLPKIDVTHVKI